jgi:hypothetical protein
MQRANLGETERSSIISPAKAETIEQWRAVLVESRVNNTNYCSTKGHRMANGKDDASIPYTMTLSGYYMILVASNTDRITGLVVDPRGPTLNVMSEIVDHRASKQSCSCIHWPGTRGRRHPTRAHIRRDRQRHHSRGNPKRWCDPRCVPCDDGGSFRRRRESSRERELEGSAHVAHFIRGRLGWMHCPCCVCTCQYTRTTVTAHSAAAEWFRPQP